MMETDLDTISSEILGVSAGLTGLSMYYAEEGTARLSDRYLARALYGFAQYLERINEDIERIEREYKPVSGKTKEI